MIASSSEPAVRGNVLDDLAEDMLIGGLPRDPFLLDASNELGDRQLGEASALS